MRNLSEFLEHLQHQGKSTNTIKGYKININGYLKWYKTTYQDECKELCRKSILGYIDYLKDIKISDAKTINHKLSSLRSYNKFLVEKKVQSFMAIHTTDTIKIQTQYASPTVVTDKEVKEFFKRIKKSNNKRNHAIVILLAYTGLRISEALSIRLSDFNLKNRECIIRSGKGDKQRTVYLNQRVIHALSEYLKERKNYSTSSSSNFLFVSRKNGRLNRTVVNKIFNKFSDRITPHQLRHYFCTNALENGFSIHEVAYQAGHSNINTTLIYTNPSKDKIKEKMDKLG